jgi:hypothetical protein
MEDLIKALQIFMKYQNRTYPTICRHETLFVISITENEVSEEDKKTLNELGFHWCDNYECWKSFKYGSS